MFLSLLLGVACASSALAVNFNWEKVQLTEAETRNYSAIAFGNVGRIPTTYDCKYVPGDKEWPSDAEWAKFNQTLQGALLKPLPLGSVCYAGPNYNPTRCASLQRSWASMNIHTENPISVMSQWSTGDSCVPTSNPNSTCTQGGYPIYVVNATTARHIQLAVNFARNQNIRLVIKNSGHNFNGVSVGGGALSIWVHNLKDYKYIPSYNSSDYTGRAFSYSAGFQAQDAYEPQALYNFTLLNAGGPGVGIAGGFLHGAGHSTYTSYYGLAADHVLSIQIVTATGRLLTASSSENEDLFWALRGGGGGNWGIITSVIVKAFPNTPVAAGTITFSTVPPQGTNQTAISPDTFWAGMRAYWEHAVALVDAGGLGYNFIRHTPNGNSSYLTFIVNYSLPNYSAAQYRTLLTPLVTKLRALGINVPLPSGLQVKRSFHYHPANDPVHALAQQRNTNGRYESRAVGDLIGNTLIASRLWPRSNFETSAGLNELNNAIRTVIETGTGKGGYTFHGMNYGPSLKVSGNPDNAVNPAFRDTLMHAQAYEGDAWWDTLAPQTSFSDLKARHDRLQSFLQKWRDITEGSGCYMNEGDAQSPYWKWEFYGENYQRLSAIKRRWDPYGVFWAVSGVNSDEWEVTNSTGGGRSGIYTQDGKLCRV